MWNVSCPLSCPSPLPTPAWPPPCQRRPYDPSLTQPGHLARPAPAGQSISERSKPASITSVPVENRWSHQVSSFGNPAGGTRPEPQSHPELPIRGSVRGTSRELWVTRVQADARILITHKIAQWRNSPASALWQHRSIRPSTVTTGHSVELRTRTTGLLPRPRKRRIIRSGARTRLKHKVTLAVHHHQDAGVRPARPGQTRQSGPPPALQRSRRGASATTTRSLPSAASAIRASVVRLPSGGTMR